MLYAEARSTNDAAATQTNLEAKYPKYHEISAWDAGTNAASRLLHTVTHCYTLLHTAAHTRAAHTRTHEACAQVDVTCTYTDRQACTSIPTTSLTNCTRSAAIVCVYLRL